MGEDPQNTGLKGLLGDVVPFKLAVYKLHSLRECWVSHSPFPRNALRRTEIRIPDPPLALSLEKSIFLSWF